MSNKDSIINDEYNELINFINTFISKINNSAFHSINTFVNNKILKLKDNNLLKNKDEEIFVHCNYINDRFKGLICFYDENKHKIVSQNKKEILDGLKNILSAQVNQYFEIYNEKDINPILEEKLKIIKHSIGNFERKQIKSLDNNTIILERDISKEVIFVMSKSENAEEIFAKAISDNFNNFIKTNTYINYMLVKRDCLNNINDLDKRKITTKYFELIKQEYEILSSIIKIQVTPLEEYDNDKEEENIIIHEMLGIIRESYQYISKKYDELTEFLTEAETDIIEEEYSEELFTGECSEFLIESIYKSNLEIKFFMNIVREKYSTLFNNIYKDVLNKTYTDFSLYSKNIYSDIKKQIKESEKMTKELLSAVNIYINFKNAKNDLIKNIPNEEIIKGINETLEIKKESILEKQEEFKIKSQGILNYIQENITLTDKEKEYLGQLIFSFDKQVDDISEEIYDFIMKDEDFIIIKDKKLKLIDAKKEKADKEILSYIRDNILYEIMTFEEINYYSIPKLKESEHELVNEYIFIFERTLSYLDRILSNNGIERIKPMPHDIFNAKEHEVLVAEQKEGFQKGEVIKTLNNGFKHDEKILIRANIIAAK